MLKTSSDDGTAARCIYRKGDWEWNETHAGTYAFTYGETNYVCEGNGVKDCGESNLCEVATASGSDYICLGDHWEEVGSKEYFPTSEDDQLCSVDEGPLTCDGSGICKWRSDGDDYFCVQESGEYAWKEGTGAGYANNNAKFLCDCSGRTPSDMFCPQRVCDYDQDKICAKYSIGGTSYNFFCAYDSNLGDWVFKESTAENYGPFYDTSSAHHMCIASVSGGADDLVCGADGGGYACERYDGNLGGPYTCVYISGWLWSLNAFGGGTGTFFVPYEKTGYLCYVEADEGKGECCSGNGCRFKEFSPDNFYTCFANSQGGFWVNNKVVVTRYDDKTGEDVVSDSPFICPGGGGLQYKSYVPCDTQRLCTLQNSYSSTMSESRDYFCVVSGEYSWVTASADDLGKPYYPNPFNSGTGGDNVVCTENLDGSCVGSGYSGAFCGTDGGIDEAQDVSDGCYAWLGSAQYVCQAGDWKNSFSPDNYQFQCPLPTSSNPEYWSNYGAPFIAAGPAAVKGKILGLEGSCYDEGPGTADIESISYDGSKLSFKLKAGVTGEPTCEAAFGTQTSAPVMCAGQNIGTAQKVSASKFTLRIIGAELTVRTDQTVTKKQDYLQCVTSTGTQAACSVVRGSGITVNDVCHDGNKVSLGTVVDVTYNGGKYKYECNYYSPDGAGDYGFLQVPRLYIEDATTVSADSDNPSEGSVSYFINSQAGYMYYHFKYGLKLSRYGDYSFPLNIDGGYYTIACSIKSADGGSATSSTSETLADLLEIRDGIADLREAEKEELTRDLTAECKIRGPVNEAIPTLKREWTYSYQFQVDDQGATCSRNDDCFGVCIITGDDENGVCSDPDSICSSEWTWDGGSSAYRDFCSSCGGYMVSEGISFDQPYYVQTDFDRISYYTPAQTNPNGKVDCSSGTCVYQGSPFWSKAASYFEIDGNGWTVSGSTISLAPAAGYSRCSDDPRDACKDAVKVVDIRQVSGEARFDIYSSVGGFCVGNQDSELKTCSGTTCQSSESTCDFGGTEETSVVLEVQELSTAEGGAFSISYMDDQGVFVDDGVNVNCDFPLGWEAAACTQTGALSIRSVRVITGQGITDRFDVYIPFGNSYRRVRIRCAHSDHQCHSNAVSDILEKFPGETVSTVTGGVQVAKPVGDVWRCVPGEKLWVPIVTLDLLEHEMVIPDPNEPLYETVGLTLVFEKTEWPDKASDILYRFGSVQCEALGMDGAADINCDGSSSCEFQSSDLQRDVIVSSCSNPSSCILGSTCSGKVYVSKGDIDRSYQLGKLVYLSLLYDDVGTSCYSSADCLGICNITETYNKSGSRAVYSFNSLNWGGSPGKCVAITLDPESRKCYAGSYIEDVLDYGGTFTPGDAPYKIACDGKTQGISACNSECEYTCKWAIDRTDIYVDKGYPLSQGFPSLDHDGCEEGESYSNCRDCCEAPSGPVINAECDRNSDYIARIETGSPEYCGIKSMDSYEGNDLTCFSSCGADQTCDAMKAGGTPCTEWCQPRTDYEPRLLFKDKYGSDVYSLSTCKSYDSCFILPFKPHCDVVGGCTLYFGSTSYPLIIGSTKYGRGGQSSVKFYESDVSYDDVNLGWTFCTADGSPIRAVPSETELGTIAEDTRAAFNFRFRLGTESEGAYDFPAAYFTSDILVTQSQEACGVSGACIYATDCADYLRPGQDPETNTVPLCGGYRCADPDAVGVYFGTILAEDHDSPNWSGCQIGSCQYDLYSCRAYFLGLDITDETFLLGNLGTITEVSVDVGGISKDFRLESPISTAYQGIPTVNGSKFNGPYPISSTIGPLVIPGSLINANSYLFTTLRDSTGQEVTSIAELKFPASSTKCHSVDLLSTGYLETDEVDTFSGYDDDEVACYYNDSCLTYGTGADPTANGDYGEVSTCLSLSGNRRLDLNDYGTSSNYNLAGLCTNTCGNTACESHLLEKPTNCRDCCSDYATGIVGQDYLTCYQHCDAPSQCDKVKVGTVVDGGVCGIRNGACSYVTDYTEIEEVAMSPGTSVINGSCYGEMPEMFCDFWVDYATDASITFDLDEGMWNSVQDLPTEFSGLKNVSISLEGGTKKEFGVGILPEAKVTLPVNMDRTYGLKVLKYTVRQKNRRGTTVTVNIHTMYKSDLKLSKITNRGCYYRAGSGNVCEIPPVSTALTFSANSSEGPAAVGAHCSVDSISKDVTLQYNDQLFQQSGRYAATGVFSFSPSDMKVGKHTVTCSVAAPYFYTAQRTLLVSIFGQLKTVEASVPSEIVPGSSYSLFVSRVVDERGQVVPFYTYNWELRQGEISVPFGQTDIIDVPHNFVEGDAELVLKVDADYYDDFERSYPVTIRIPQQISASISPGIIYVPLAGSQSVRAKLLLSNSGPTVNVTVEYSAPKDLLVVLPLTVVNVEGFNIDELPVTIAVPQKMADTDYVVTFKAYMTGKLQDQISLRIVQTQQPVYEFDIFPLEQDIDLIYDEAEGNVTLMNVGNMKDSYVVNSDMDVSDYEIVLEPAASKELTITTKIAGEYRLCIRSVRLLDREPRCVTAAVARKEVTPTITAQDLEITMDPSRGASLLFNLSTAQYSGTYMIDFDTNLTMIPYERSFRENTNTMISVPFSTRRSGTYVVKATAYPKKYPDKSDTATVWVMVTLPAPFEINALLEAIEASGVKDMEVLRSVALAKKLVEEGDFEEARNLLEQVTQQIERLEKIGSYKISAGMMNPTRSYTFVIVGVVLIVAGVVLYLK